MNTFPQLLFLIFTFALAEKATAQFNPGSAFVQSANLFDQDLLVDLGVQLAESQRSPEGDTPANVVIERAVSFPQAGGSDVIVLRNVGGKVADLSNWEIRDSSPSEPPFKLDPLVCGDVLHLTGGESLQLFPASPENRCGFEFGLSYKDEVKVFDASGEMVTSVSWVSSERGTSVHRMPGGGYSRVREDTHVVELLRSLGGYEIFVEALEALGFADTLGSAADPDYSGPTLPVGPQEEIIPEFPWWFGYTVNRSDLPPSVPPPPPPKPVEGIPEQGPYTLVAPSNDAFNFLLSGLGGFGKSVSKKTFLDYPELKDIILHHVIPGRWTSNYLKNDTNIITAKAIPVTAFNDPPTTEGKIMLHDSCLDKPTPDRYECEEQVEFGKCFDPFMTSPLGAQWQGGYCEKACMRCSCAPDRGSFCTEVQGVDFMTPNGVVHLIDRVIFPPPKFEKVIPEDVAPVLKSETKLSSDDVRTILKTKPTQSSRG